MSLYNPQIIELKWQKVWEEKNLFKSVEDSKKYYILGMLPYPSGRIHMGHVRNYTIVDVEARFKRMNGFSVLHPMGWDAFGLPAENAAIKNKIHPAKWTYENIDVMRTQLKRMGYSVDWEREFATCDADYYRWEQFLFLKMFEKGMVYRKEKLLNWCDGCKTVLANEQVKEGKCWRCSTIVAQKPLEQWFFKITDYAEELLNDIDNKLQGWPDRVKIMQKEWIGRSDGAAIDFAVEGFEEKIRIFTTRPDTLYGATFMSLACEHPLLMELAQKGGKQKEVQAFVEKTSHLERMKRLTGEYEKEGVFTGCYCINPVTQEKMPIYAANFVLMDYGTGAVMAVPAHDQRDFEFAKKYKLPLRLVIQPEAEKLSVEKMEAAYEGPGKLVASSEFDGLDNEEAKKKITQKLKKMGVGDVTVHFRLKDWCLSRQRYWGAPIPIIYCTDCGTVPVPEKDLPVKLPTDVPFTGEGGSPLSKVENFVNVKCPVCGKKARRETDTMDTFVESSWYLLRYVSPKYDKGMVDPKKIDYWLPIDQYVGGIEHAVGHLIYSRYFTKVMRDLGMIQLNEPVTNLMCQGMVCLGGSAMSKSKGNVVDPDTIIEKYGADTARLFILFAAPVEKDLEWNDAAVEGMFRFLGRVWRLVVESKNQKAKIENDKAEEWRNKTIKKVTEDLGKFHFNTAISSLMEYVNYLQTLGQGPGIKDVEALVILLSPLAPHIAEELWQHLGHKQSVLQEPWPTWDEKALVASKMLIVVQVNGKLRGNMEVPVDEKEELIKSQALALEKVKPFLDGKQIVKTIYVPGKLMNIVVK